MGLKNKQGYCTIITMHYIAASSQPASEYWPIVFKENIIISTSLWTLLCANNGLMLLIACSMHASVPLLYELQRILTVWSP